jgi:hypothetical protein
MREHPAKLEVFDRALEVCRILVHAFQRRFVVLVARDLEKLLRVAHAVSELFQRADDAFERFSFLAEVLRALRLVPDVGVFGEACDFAQAQFLPIEVKDTSAARARGSPRPPDAWRSC